MRAWLINRITTTNMKNKQLIKSVAIFSILTFLMMLTLGHFALSAESAAAPAGAASAPVQSSADAAKTVAFYDCLHSKKNNYFWTMTVSKSLPQTVTGAMTVNDILVHSGPEEVVGQIVMDSAQKSIMRMISKAIANSSKEDFNLMKEFSHNVRLFSRYLRFRLNAQKDLSFKSPIVYEILIAPRLSEVLMDRRNKGIVPRLSVYPIDRVKVAEPILDNDTFKPYAVDKSDTALDGIESLSYDALTCGESAGIHQAFPASILLRMTVTPDIDSSSINAQFVVGMPTASGPEQDIPFTQANEQIAFKAIKLPKTVKDDAATRGNAAQLKYFQYPMAFINISKTLDKEAIEVEAHFGNLGGGMSETGWSRALTPDDQMSLLPKLSGVPAGKIKDQLVVNFNIYNLALTIDYTKYGEKKAVEVKELDLLISAGLNKWPNLTFGKFNVTSVNDQFKQEINKAIVAQIDAQEATIKKKINDAKANVSKETGLSPEQIEGVLAIMFSKTRTATSTVGSK